MKIDCVRMIEAGYAPASSSEAWLHEILAALEPLALGSGLLVSAFDLTGWRPHLRSQVSRGPVPPVVREAYRKLFQFLERKPARLNRILHSPPPSVCWARSRASRLPDSVHDEIHTFFAGANMHDYLGVVAIEPGDSGLLFTIPYEREVSIPARTAWQLTRVTAHFCSAMRLRARVRESDAPDAILDSSGRVHHAVGDARSAPVRTTLGAAVRSVERARGRLRRADPDEALAIWQALFDGRYSIVERSEADGRRFLLARRNEPGIRDPKALGPPERNVLAYAALGHSNKYIGYLLGIAPSTVASRLASALRKLGVGSRREAIELLGGAAPGTRDRPA